MVQLDNDLISVPTWLEGLENAKYRKTQKGYPKVEIIKQIRRMSESERILCAKTLYTLQFFTLVVSLRNYGV